MIPQEEQRGLMWHGKDGETVFRELGTSPGGLEAEEAGRRLETYGYNELEKERRASPLKLFLNQFKNVLIIILMVATVLSAAIGETVDALIIGVIIVFSAALGFIQEYRAERALEALKKMLSLSITVLRGGMEVEVDSRELVPGDIMLLEAGDKVPADGRVVESSSLRCDEAPLTGESLPVGKGTGALPPSTQMADRKNMVYTGSVVTYGRARAVVTGTGMQTEFGKIAREVAAVKEGKTPLEKRTAEIGKWLGLVTLFICLVVIGVSAVREMMAGSLSFDSGIKMLMFGVALAVAAVPEALAAIVTGALAIGMRDMAKRNALVRKMPAVETLGCTTVICTDKTGTLTKGEMTVRRIFVDGSPLEVTGAGYEPSGEIKGGGPALEILLKGAVLCNDANIMEAEGRWAIKGDPTEAALVVAGIKGGLDHVGLRAASPRLDEVPFSSERKLMTTVHAGDGGGRIAYSKGAPEVVLGISTGIMETDGSVRPINDKDREDILKANGEMASGALRVLALGFKVLSDGETLQAETDVVFTGLVGMMDPPRPEALEAVRVCKEVHMRPVMITGDHKLTALAVAREMGISREGDMALTGEELEAMGDGEFEALVDKVSVYARVSPTDKLKIVNAWKKRGEVVAMTGDGVNDAPALKHADIGIAMGITGTEVAKEAADIVLSDDNFATIVSAVERGRWIYENIKKYLTFLLRCNITEVLVIGGVVLAMGPEYLPLLPAAILYVNLATDGLPALALGVAPPDPDIMRRPPRDPGESVFSGEVRAFIVMAVIVELPIFLWMFFVSLPDMELARTRMFFMFILVELAIAMNFRSLRYSILSAPPHKWLVVALLWEVALIAALVQLPAVRDSFGIQMPGPGDLMQTLGFGLFVLLAMEGVKAALRRRAARPS
jgi:Ca2+-transporting ATPase